MMSGTLKTLMIAALAGNLTFAADTASEPILEKAKKNILLTLRGINENLQAQSLETLLELQKENPSFTVTEAIPALADLVESHRSISVRILAALNLQASGDERAFEIIRKASKKNSNAAVRTVCCGIVESLK